MDGSAIDRLLREHRIERVRSDRVAAASMLEEAERHLLAAERIADLDPNGAYELLYTAARKAVTAHMFENGYRVAKSRLGGHDAVVQYAEAALIGSVARENVLQMDRMRRNRNRSEYGVRRFSEAEIREDLRHARAIVESVLRRE
ncbi:MAG TPA: hypothetical protein VFU47_11745 [Armatimonadota bacterium]|nr:hypothetical protein [Armatimonadota bacterium]